MATAGECPLDRNQKRLLFRFCWKAKSPNLIQLVLPRSSNFVSPGSPRVRILDIDDMATSFGHNLLLADKLNSWSLRVTKYVAENSWGSRCHVSERSIKRPRTWLSAVRRGNPTCVLTLDYAIWISLTSSWTTISTTHGKKMSWSQTHNFYPCN